MFESVNILGGPLQNCCKDPVTGFFRDGYCNTDYNDTGIHTVCVKMSSEFLAFSKEMGNDLSTPRPEYQFPGLKPGDQWCLCAARWVEAYKHGKAPMVVLESTHIETLGIIPLELLREYSISS